MASVSHKAVGQELEQLQRKIWMLRSRGMTYEQIARAVGKSKSSVAYHVKQLRRQTYAALDGAGQQEVVGEILMNFREMRQEAMRNMTQVEQGSPMRAQWLDIAARRLQAETKFMMDIGLIQKAADRVELTVRDVRKMSDKEIEHEISALKRDLATTPTNFLGQSESEEETD